MSSPKNMQEHSPANCYVKTRMCSFFLKRKCTRGSACHFAHDSSELRVQPNLTKIRLCEAFLQSGWCPQEEQCKFAHGEEEIRRKKNRKRELQNPTPTTKFEGDSAWRRDWGSGEASDVIRRTMSDRSRRIRWELEKEPMKITFGQLESKVQVSLGDTNVWEEDLLEQEQDQAQQQQQEQQQEKLQEQQLQLQPQKQDKKGGQQVRQNRIDAFCMDQPQQQQQQKQKKLSGKTGQDTELEEEPKEYRENQNDKEDGEREEEDEPPLERRNCRRHTVASFCLAVGGSTKEGVGLGKPKAKLSAEEAQGQSSEQQQQKKSSDEEEGEETEMPLTRRQHRRHTITTLCSMGATSSAKETRRSRISNSSNSNKKIDNDGSDDDNDDASPKSTKSEGMMCQAASFPGCRGRSSPRWSDIGSDGEDDVWQSFRINAGILTLSQNNKDDSENEEEEVSVSTTLPRPQLLGGYPSGSPVEMTFGATQSWSPGTKGKAKRNLTLPVPKRKLPDVELAMELEGDGEGEKEPPTPGSPKVTFADLQ